MEPEERVRAARRASAEERARELEALASAVKSPELQQWVFTPELYAGLFGLIVTALSWRSKDAQAHILQAQQVFWAAVHAPKFDVAAADAELSEEFLWSLGSRSDGSASQEEWPFLRDVFLWLYQHFVSRRRQLRTLLGRSLRSYGQRLHKAAPVAPLLQVLAPIVRGFSYPLSQADKALLFEILMPLHRSNEWSQWDRQTPLISLYHKELVHCILLFLDKQPTLTGKCLEVLCSHFPQSREANTPKEVLLIHEIGQVMKYADRSTLKQALPLLLRHMIRLLSSHNAQPIQSVLQFWKDDHVAKVFNELSTDLIPPLLPVLLRGGEIFWNPTVNRMTSLVLEKLERSNPEVFAEVAEQVWGPGREVPAYEVAAAEAAAAAAEAAARAAAAERDAEPAKPAPNVASLKFCLGGWKPPSGPGAGGGGGAGRPPVTATGVAPWAFKGGAGQAQPPVTATGVAPWAFSGKPKAGPLGGAAACSSESVAPKHPVRVSLGSLPEEAVQEAKSGLDRVHEYMKRLCPDDPAGGGGGAPWEAALTAETPTLLPTLRFHQLVFGPDDLGVGAFSVVRYARAIQQGKTQSQWPEYAVKVINTKTMEELGYEASVNREICVLRMLSHPGIARMVSSFRWRDGAYLVLEYASKGDMHGILRKLGKLEEDTARFFLGETLAALDAIHHIGFVYGDLKPENIVVTATWHAKITDFGGCRPITLDARERTRQSLLRGLRDGDWRAKDNPDGEAQDGSGPAASAEVEDDGRVEGTTMYLPPEVVSGGTPTLTADAWAYGCLVYQLLTGKPPVWVDSDHDEDLRARILSFRFDEGVEGAELPSASARSLVGALLQVDPVQRLSTGQAAEADFFEAMDVFSLYKRPRGPELPVHERQAPQGDARWQKRQFSKIWTVMPSQEDYVLPDVVGGPRSTVVTIEETDAERGVPFGDEAVLPLAVGRLESL